MDDNGKLAKELLSIARELTAGEKTASQSRVNTWCREITKNYNGLVTALGQAVAEGATCLRESHDKVRALGDMIQNAVFKAYKK